MRLNPLETALVFPGQGSQKLGMGFELARAFPAARETFAEADELLGRSLSRIAWDGPESELNDTANTQPALMVHSVAALRVLQQRMPIDTLAFVAGHSMGQLTALVAAEALPFPEALRLVQRRGELMKKAGERAPGGMAAVLGLDIPALEDICTRASRQHEVVQVANDNCPGQVVISGATAAVRRAIGLAQEAGARRAVELAVSIAAHSPLMAHAQEAFNQAVDAAPLAEPITPLVGNVGAEPLRTTLEIRSDLKAQLTSRVRWAESIQTMRAAGIRTFVEMGSGNVLTGLLRRIDRDLVGIPCGSPEDFERFAE